MNKQKERPQSEVRAPVMLLVSALPVLASVRMRLLSQVY